MARKGLFKRSMGNSLIEYALPAGIFVIGVGIITTSMDVTGMMGSYFASANGDSASAIKNNAYTASSQGLSASGQQGDGRANFTLDGQKHSIETIGEGYLGSRQQAFIMSGQSAGDATGSFSVEQVFNALSRSKNLAEVYLSINEKNLPDEFVQLIQGMAMQQYAMANATSDKTKTINNNADGTVDIDYGKMGQANNLIVANQNGLSNLTLEMLMYAAKAENANEITAAGGQAAAEAALNISMNSRETGDEAVDENRNKDRLISLNYQLLGMGKITQAIPPRQGAVSDTQELLLRELNLNPGDPLAGMVLDSLNDGGSFADLRAASKGFVPQLADEFADMAQGDCVNTEVCTLEADRLMAELKGSAAASTSTGTETATETEITN